MSEAKNSNPEVAEHFATFRQDILRFLRGRVASPEIADDLLQQTFLRLLQRADWTKIKNPEAYLRTTARHVVADFYRRQNAKNHGVTLDFNEQRHKDETWSPSRMQQSREALDEFAVVLESMSPQVRKAFVLSRVYGYTYAEIGAALSISPRTVEKHVAKGLAKCFESKIASRNANAAKNGRTK